MIKDIKQFMSKNNMNPLPMQNNNPLTVPIDANLINSLEDICCIMCGGNEFVNITRVKKIPRTLSRIGQEALINVNMMKCRKCDYLFNPKEWDEHRKADENEKEEEVIKETEEEAINDVDILKDETDAAIDDKIICRKCGTFYPSDEKHICG